MAKIHIAIILLGLCLVCNSAGFDSDTNEMSIFLVFHTSIYTNPGWKSTFVFICILNGLVFLLGWESFL
ncbi:hypothetical protein AAHE18_05G157400 [Arachis hypogaea]